MKRMLFTTLIFLNIDMTADGFFDPLTNQLRTKNAHATRLFLASQDRKHTHSQMMRKNKDDLKSPSIEEESEQYLPTYQTTHGQKASCVDQINKGLLPDLHRCKSGETWIESVSAPQVSIRSIPSEETGCSCNTGIGFPLNQTYWWGLCFFIYFVLHKRKKESEKESSLT